MRVLFSVIFWLTVVCQPSMAGSIGFFSPGGVYEGFAGKVDFAVIQPQSPAALSRNLALAKQVGMSVFLDISDLTATSANSNSIKKFYISEEGSNLQKFYKPLDNNKLRRFLSKEKIRSNISPYADILRQYQSQITAFFLLDEPYLNGVTRQELSRAADDVRSILSSDGLKYPQMAANFAMAMFDKGFAEQADDAAGRYVDMIDKYRGTIEGTPGFAEWDRHMRTARLTTYDQANNMFLVGGVPAGLDLISFDFYESVMLFDFYADRALEWFAKNVPSAPCQMFEDKTVRDLWGQLSFFYKDGAEHGSPETDKKILDAAYRCRMEATLHLLEEDILKSGSHAKIMVITESSALGVRNFNLQGQPHAEQDQKAAGQRALDEVERGLAFYQAHKEIDYLAFFTYHDAYDSSIHLNISGAQSLPMVTDMIFDAASPKRERSD